MSMFITVLTAILLNMNASAASSKHLHSFALFGGSGFTEFSAGHRVLVGLWV